MLSHIMITIKQIPNTNKILTEQVCTLALTKARLVVHGGAVAV